MPTRLSALLAALVLAASVTGCKKDADKQSAEAPPANPQVVREDPNGTVHIADSKLFTLSTAEARGVQPRLNVTGTVTPDVSRELPVLSLANGRVVALHVQLGDTVRKGQLVMDVQSPDVATAFNGYLKAVADEHLTHTALDRANTLLDKGAISRSQQEAAQNAEDDNKADLTAAEQQLRILGVDKAHPSDTVHIYAPSNGIVVAQNVTAAGAAGISYAGNGGSLTIADLSHVWVLCDVYENDLAKLHLGQRADIRLNAYPDKVFHGTISDIGAQLDPSLRTAKVRIQVDNPGGLMRLGMFVTATILAGGTQTAAAVPTTAVLQLHDRAYVFVPAAGDGNFRRVEVKLGDTLDGGFVTVTQGITPGQQVVTAALSMQNTVDQQ